MDSIIASHPAAKGLDFGSTLPSKEFFFIFDDVTMSFIDRAHWLE